MAKRFVGVVVIFCLFIVLIALVNTAHDACSLSAVCLCSALFPLFAPASAYSTTCCIEIVPIVSMLNHVVVIVEGAGEDDVVTVEGGGGEALL